MIHFNEIKQIMNNRFKQNLNLSKRSIHSNSIGLCKSSSLGFPRNPMSLTLRLKNKGKAPIKNINDISTTNSISLSSKFMHLNSSVKSNYTLNKSQHKRGAKSSSLDSKSVSKKKKVYKPAQFLDLKALKFKDLPNKMSPPFTQRNQSNNFLKEIRNSSSGYLSNRSNNSVYKTNYKTNINNNNNYSPILKKDEQAVKLIELKARCKNILEMYSNIVEKMKKNYYKK